MDFGFVNALLEKSSFTNRLCTLSMPRSKLQLYEEIICSMTKKALTIDEIAFECGTNCILLQNRLNFLAKQEIVNVVTGRDNRKLYVLTRRGSAISKTVANTRRLEKLQTSPQSSV